MTEQKEEPNFGIPEVDNSPMGIIKMEGNFFRKIGEHKKNRPLVVRFFAIFVALFLFLIPGAFYLFISFTGYNESGLSNVFAPAGFGLIFFLAGLVGIYANIRKKP